MALTASTYSRILRAGGKPLHTKSPFVVAPDLTAETQLKPSPTRTLQVPTYVGGNHWASRKRYSYAGCQCQFLRVNRRYSERKKGIMSIFKRDYAVVSVLFDALNCMEYLGGLLEGMS